MLRSFFRKQHPVQVLVLKYLEILRMTQEHFSLALETCLTDDNVCGDFGFLSDETHRFESHADDVREEIKVLMYGKVLLPESRGDIMGLLESIDHIPRLFEIILNIIRTQKLAIPDIIVSDVRELVRVSLETCDLMIMQVEDLMQRGRRITEFIDVIDKKESQCDVIERRIIVMLFDSDIDPFIKLQLKELVVFLGDISDQADRVSKRINIINLKRRV
jgi:predicted phosphate transport protein (TIGR00153 family)